MPFQLVWRLSASESMNVLSPRTTADISRHQIARVEFLRHVLADDRTRARYAQWAERNGLNGAVDRLGILLDAAAHQAGGLQRFEMYGNVAVLATLSAFDQARMASAQEDIDSLLSSHRPALLREAMDFGADALGLPGRWLGWFSLDFLRLFGVELAAHVWGSTILAGLGPALSVPCVDPGREREAPLDRDVGWYYSARVQVPNVPIAELARAYHRSCEKAGEFHAPKDHGELTQRVDTKLVRTRIREVVRLLSLPLSPNVLDGLLPQIQL